MTNIRSGAAWPELIYHNGLMQGYCRWSDGVLTTLELLVNDVIGNIVSRVLNVEWKEPPGLDEE